MATREDIRAEFPTLLHEVTRISIDEIRPNASFVADLNLDSLAMVEMALAVQERFGVRIADDELLQLDTVDEAIAYIERARG